MPTDGNPWAWAKPPDPQAQSANGLRSSAPSGLGRVRKGLTLVELLLALSLAAVILVEVSAIFWGARRAYEREVLSAERDTQAWSALELLGEDVERVSYPTPDAASLLGAAEVAGEPAPLLRLRTTGRLGPQGCGALVDWFVVPRDGRRMLARRSQPIHCSRTLEIFALADEDAEARYEVVLPALESLRIRYFDGLAWHDRWDAASQGRLPRLVEVTLELPAVETGQTRYRRQFELDRATPFETEPAGPGGGS